MPIKSRNKQNWVFTRASSSLKLNLKQIELGGEENVSTMHFSKIEGSTQTLPTRRSYIVSIYTAIIFSQIIKCDEFNSGNPIQFSWAIKLQIPWQKSVLLHLCFTVSIFVGDASIASIFYFFELLLHRGSDVHTVISIQTDWASMDEFIEP